MAGDDDTGGDAGSPGAAASLPDGVDGSPDDPARVVVAWSGGKDAAFVLRHLLDREDVAVVELLTTTAGDRTKAHRLRPGLVDRQADALGLSVRFVELPPDPDNEAYEAALTDAFAAAADRGVDAVAYADLLLDDVRAYREGLLEGTGLAGWWPIWGLDTGALAGEFLDAGFEARLVAVEGDALDASFAGRPYGEALDEFPGGVDPAGEHGEFHTFVTDGPIFEEPVAVDPGELTTREDEHAGRTVHYRDLLPVD